MLQAIQMTPNSFRNRGEFSWAGNYRALGRHWDKGLERLPAAFHTCSPSPFIPDPFYYFSADLLSLIVQYIS